MAGAPRAGRAPARVIQGFAGRAENRPPNPGPITRRHFPENDHVSRS
ncbi:hypothetical protein APASM_0426 [Actinosynnema pretiosum subsp. pretiosum]|nr:hypothetical protein APASM_0426 [Actinosynnema pretiosum subsp. pretiosum]